MAHKIDQHSAVVRNSQLLSSQIDDDVVILSIESGQYYGTQVVGRRIWQLLEQPIQVEAICTQLMEEFEVDQKTCEHDVLEFLRQLHAEKLIDVQ